MLPATLLLLCVAAIEARAASTTNEFYSTTFSTLSSIQSSDFAGTQYTYIQGNSQSTVSSASLNATGTSTTSNSQITRSTKSESLIHIGGQSRTSHGTASSTSTGPAATNTVPCNGYPEFCERKYSNITEVCAHNSMFAIPNNAGSNQMLGLRDQLNDGVRMLQGETHWVNDTIMSCHTTCDLLDAGTWQSGLEVVASWLDDHPYDVVTWLIVNSDFHKNIEDYAAAIQNAGLGRYVYTPEYIPQHRDQWPTLAEMILSNQRMVFFMDYDANQTAVPYIMDEFTHIWETPFSPTNQSFPCDQQRPPGLNQTKARDEFMYLANHNLNTAVDISALIGGGSKQEILIPNTAEINQTNGEFNQFGQMEAMSLNCTQQWDNPPNFLLVDYYNLGDPREGSVFEVSARANGV